MNLELLPLERRRRFDEFFVKKTKLQSLYNSFLFSKITSFRFSLSSVKEMVLIVAGQWLKVGDGT